MKVLSDIAGGQPAHTRSCGFLDLLSIVSWLVQCGGRTQVGGVLWHWPTNSL